jgi:hypothetical protein
VEKEAVLMFSIISFGNVRMSGMGKNLVTSYAALGVGLALVLTFGLTAISSINTQMYDSADRAVFTVTDPDQNLRSKASEETSGRESASEGPVPAAPPQMQFAEPPEGNVSTEAGAGVGSGDVLEAPTEKMPASEEASRENYVITTEAPAASGSFAGILMALPYIAAAAVGSAVFAVTRKRVGW